VKAYWQFLAALWPDDETTANYPVSPGGQVPTLQTDGTVKWSAAAPGGSDLIEAGDMIYEDGNPLYE
jgi:hypothetical protein